jgi:hypothetical protein
MLKVEKQNNVITIGKVEKIPFDNIETFVRLIFSNVILEKNKIEITLESNENQILLSTLKNDLENICKYEVLKKEFEKTLNNITHDTKIDFIDSVEAKIGILEIMKYRISDVNSKKLWVDKAHDNAIEIKNLVNNSSKGTQNRIILIEKQNKALGDKSYAENYYKRYLRASNKLKQIDVLQKIDDNYSVVSNSKIATLIIENINLSVEEISAIIEKTKTDSSPLFFSNDDIFKEIQKIKVEKFNPNQQSQDRMGKRNKPPVRKTNGNNSRMPMPRPTSQVEKKMDEIAKSEEDK